MQDKSFETPAPRQRLTRCGMRVLGCVEWLTGIIPAAACFTAAARIIASPPAWAWPGTIQYAAMWLGMVMLAATLLVELPGRAAGRLEDWLERHGIDTA